MKTSEGVGGLTKILMLQSGNKLVGIHKYKIAKSSWQTLQKTSKRSDIDCKSNPKAEVEINVETKLGLG